MIADVRADFGDVSDSSGRVTRIGLANRDDDRLLEHSTLDDQMSIVDLDQVGDGFIFSLPTEQEIESIVVWNYNKPAYTDQGVSTMDVSVWTETDGWKTVLKAADLQEAEGTDDYDEPTVLVVKPVLAQKIRFENLTTFASKSKQVGLSEVRFHGPLGPSACNPEPSDGLEVSYHEATSLAWGAGRNAVVHDVYVGESEASLEFLGRVKGVPQVAVSGLSAGQSYMWRIDEVTKDGAVETGAVWSFTTKGSLVGYWPLDESFEDSAGGRNGTFAGTPVWADGYTGKALTFDGKQDVVEIPALSLNTDVMTICAWLKPDPRVNQVSGLVFCRAGNTIAGMNLNGDGLRYHWNDMNAAYDWDSGLQVPTDGAWVFAALTVQPDKGVLYCYRDGELKSSENRIVHQIEEFDGLLCLGRDSCETRYYKGMIDEVRIFDFALSASQIDQVRQGQTPALSGVGAIQLVDADLVEKGESLEEVVAEQEKQADPQKMTNLMPVVIIIVIVLVIAMLSTFRKKK